MNEQNLILADRNIQNFIAKQSSEYQIRYQAFIDSCESLYDKLDSAKSQETIDLIKLLIVEQVKSLSKDFPEVWAFIPEEYKEALDKT